MGIQAHGALLEIDRSVIATWWPRESSGDFIFSATAFVGILSTPSTKRVPARANGKSSVPFTFRQRSGAVETAKIFLAAGISITPESATPFIEPI